jgi:hypothetical protein
MSPPIKGSDISTSTGQTRYGLEPSPAGAPYHQPISRCPRACEPINYPFAMNTNSLLFFIFLLEIVIVFLLIRRVGRVPRTFVLDYQRGVRFLSGAFSNVVGPGRYLGLSKNVQIQVMDMRPRQFVMECIAFRDALRNDSFVSIGAELIVADPYLAATRLKDQFADSLPTMRDTLRAIASRGIGDASSESRARMSDEITAAVNAELGASGMKIANLEITEIWSRPVVGKISSGLN